jgi:hypothetical protein
VNTCRIRSDLILNFAKRLYLFLGNRRSAHDIYGNKNGSVLPPRIEANQASLHSAVENECPVHQYQEVSRMADPALYIRTRAIIIPQQRTLEDQLYWETRNGFTQK